MLRKNFLYLLPALLLTACGVADDRVRIKGDFENIDKAEFYVYCDGDGFAGIDTIFIEGGKFSHDYPLKRKDVLKLLYPNFSETFIIGEPGKTISIKGDASHLNRVEVGGSEENDMLTNFRLDNTERGAKEREMAVADFIRSHPKSMAAIAVWKEYFAQAEHSEYSARQLLEVLRKAQPETPTLRLLEEQTRALVSVNKGMDLPDFSAVTLSGDTIKKADFSGKPLVIAITANWHSESPALISKLQEYQKEHTDFARVLHISADAQSENARRLHHPDTTATIVCDELMFDSPLLLRLGVRFVPSIILVDRKGKVVARDLSFKRLDEELSKL